MTKGEAGLVVPALILNLADPESLVLRNAAETLGLYQAEAKATVPRLLELRHANNGLERYYVGKALEQIEPKAAAKVGIE